MIMKKVLVAAKPYLAQKTLSDLVVGLSLIGCQLDSGEVGVSYVLRENLEQGCSNFAFIKELIGKPAWEVANYILTGDNDLERALGAAVLTAASCGQDLPDDNVKERPMGLTISSDDTVAMVGYIKPVARQLSKSVKKLTVFDQGRALSKEEPLLEPMSRQKEVLAQSDLVIITGTTTINGSIDSLLALCTKAREVVMLGPSTPMYPKGWEDSVLTRLAGSCWDQNYKEEIFKRISLSGGISSIKQYMIKKTIEVR